MLYILYGQDEYSLYETLEEIKRGIGDRAMLDINTTVLDGQQLLLEQLRTASETIPFMAPSRLVIVKGLLERFEPGTRADAQKKSARAGKEQDEYRVIVECIKGVPPSTVLVLIDEIQLKANNTLLKELSTRAEVRAFSPLRRDNLRLWIQNYLANRRGTISTEAMALLVQLVGSDLRVMASELDKLMLYTSGKIINEEDVRAVVGYAQEFNVFNMADAILGFQASTAEKSLEQLLLKGAAPAYLLVVLARQIQRVLRAKEMQNSGIAEAEIQNKLGITLPFVWQRVREQASRHSTERLIAIYDKLLETDLAIKTGRCDGELALNMVIAELCQRG